MKIPNNTFYSDIFSRNILLVGEKNQEKIKNSSVSIFGLGGVGGFVFESLVRSGIGKIYIYDFDEYEYSNINRQNGAFINTTGIKKVEYLREKAELINPDIQIEKFDTFITTDNIPDIKTDIVVDCIDTMDAKIKLLAKCVQEKKKIFSSMGTGGRLDPFLLRYGDISESSVCPMAAKVRRILRKEGITEGITVVFSLEKPMSPVQINKKNIQPSMVFVPATAGIMLAYLVIKYISSN